MYYELVLVLTILLILTTGASILYFRKVREVHEEYEEAKGVVGDVVVSFNRQFQKQEDKIQVLTNRTKVFSSAREMVVRKVEEQDRQLLKLADKIEVSTKFEQEFSTRIDRLNEEFSEVKESQRKALQRILEVEKTRARTPAFEAGIEAAIPIKKEKALAPLTETELGVLEIIAKEGRKTAPEIRDKLKLTREHTARLMKKLYEDGYLERYTNKMPYTYRLKEEMQKILKKREAKA